MVRKLIFVALVLSCVTALAQLHPSGSIAPLGTSMRNDRILVMPKTGLARQVLDTFLESKHATVLQAWPRFNGLQLVNLPVDETVAAWLVKCERSGLVEFAEPDWLVHLAGVTPDDPRYLDGSLWPLHNTGQDGGIADADIDAPEAWATATTASNIVVAVVDTGVRYTHEDLAANMWLNKLDGSHGLDALAGNHDPFDDSGHGSRLAGIIGAVGNNGVGLSGVAWRVQIMACKFANNQGGAVSEAISCIDFAITNQVGVINTSWGMYDLSQSLSNALRAARSAGILVVAAAGNDALDNDFTPYYPASLDLDNIVAVAATTRRDELYPLSNVGAASVDLAAPGLDIYSTDSTSNNAYIRDEGTSMAAAHVTGAAALLRNRYPHESPSEIIQRLLESTDRLANLMGMCVSGGRLNVRRALGQPEIVAPRLQVQRSTDGNTMEILVHGEPHQPCIIEASTNAAHWRAVITNSAGADGVMLFSDTEWGAYPQQFYRALSRE